jgi:hypothetical protein
MFNSVNQEVSKMNKGKEKNKQFSNQPAKNEQN